MEQVQDREISIIDLCYFILKEWRKLILFAILGAALFAGIFLYKNREFFISKKGNEKTLIENTNTVEGIDYELNKQAYENIINKNEELIRNYETYCQKSVLMRIDAYNKPVKIIDYYIKPKESVYEDIKNVNVSNPVDQIASAYVSKLEQTINYEELARLTNLEVPYVKEIIKIQSGNNIQKKYEYDRLEKPNNYNANKFIVSIVYDDASVMEQIAIIIDETVDEVKKDVEKVSFEHDIDSISKPVEYITDHDLIAHQKTIKDLINNSLKAISDSDTALTKLKKQSGNLSSYSTSFPKKKFIKYLLIGVFLGVFGCALVYFFIYIFGGKIHIVDELKCMYGFELLALLLNEKENKSVFAFVDKWLEKTMKKYPYNESVENAIERISIYINNACKDENNQNINVITTSNEDAVKIIIEKIKAKLTTMNISFAGNPINSVLATQNLSSAEKVILVETLEKSLFDQVNLEIDIMRQLKKQVIGYVMIGEKWK